MKVVFFNTNKIWGGGEQWHFNMLTGLAGKGIDVMGVASKSPLKERLEQSSVDVFDFNSTGVSYLNPFKLYKLYRFYKKYKVKAVVFGLPHDLKVGGLAAKMAGVEKIIYARALAAPVRNGVLNRFLFRKVVTEVVANSKETMRQMLSNNTALIPPPKRHVIYYGLNVKEHEHKEYEQLSFHTEGGFVIGNAGRLTQQKGQSYLLDLAEELIKTGVDQFKIVIAGSGELEGSIKSEIEKRNLQNKVIVLGFVDNVKSFMEAIDVFVLTSLWEGFGYVIAEAFLSKKPVVAWNTTSNPELVKNGENGYLIETGDVSEMASKIKELFDDKHKRKLLGQAGYEDVATHFSHEKELGEWGNLLEV